MPSNFDFNYEINGRKVSKDEWMRHLGEEAITKALPQVEKDVKADIAKLRCPEHGETPTIVESKIVGHELRTKISACCDDMLEKAQKVAVRQV